MEAAFKALASKLHQALDVLEAVRGENKMLKSKLEAQLAENVFLKQNMRVAHSKLNGLADQIERYQP